MSTLKVNTVLSANTPTVNITDGLSVSGVSTLSGGLKVGTAITMSDNGNFGITGILTASNFVGSGAVAGGPGITMADHWRLHTTYDVPHNSTTIISTANWERPDSSNDGFAQLGTGMSVNSSDHAAGVWTFPSTGFYLVGFGGMIVNPDNDGYEVFVRIEATENNSSFGEQTRVYLSGERYNYQGNFGQAIIDVTDTSQVKLRLRVYSASSATNLHGNSGRSETYITVIRLGDT